MSDSKNDRPLVLHLAVDYPNVYRPENTAAVRNFVKACDKLDHRVIALTRTANPFRVTQEDGDGKGDADVISMRYWGMPLGILLVLSMYIVAWQVRRELTRRRLKPQAIHAHKLTFEGLAGWFLARSLSLPLLVSVRGEAESKILRFKPHYHRLIQRILLDATRIYYVSAWFKPILNRSFRISARRQKLLPNFVAARPPQTLRTYRPGHLITVMDLNLYKKKGLDRLLPAFRECLKMHPEARLDIVGRGEPRVIAEVQHLVAQLGLEEQVSIIGEIPNTELVARLPQYAGMALPSHNETFGMIYVESILSGVPILYSKGTGIDGFLDSIDAGFSVDPKSTISISAGIENLFQRNEEIRRSLTSNRELILSRFEKERYINSYSDLIQKKITSAR